MDATTSLNIEPHNGLLRPSSLTTWADCPRRFAARHLPDLLGSAGYRLRAPGPQHVGAAIGKAVHASVAYTLWMKRSTGELGNATQAEEMAQATLVEDTANGTAWDETTPSMGTARTQVLRMTRSYRRHLAPHVTPLIVEQRMTADVGDGWQLSGQADTLAGDPYAALRDLKTGTRRRNNAVQYGAYGIVFEAHGLPVHRLLEDYLARVRTSAEQPPPETLTIPLAGAKAEAWETIDDIKARTADFQVRAADPGGRDPAGAFRANPASSLCGARWCPAHGTHFCRLTQSN